MIPISSCLIWVGVAMLVVLVMLMTPLFPVIAALWSYLKDSCGKWNRVPGSIIRVGLTAGVLWLVFHIKPVQCRDDVALQRIQRTIPVVAKVTAKIPMTQGCCPSNSHYANAK